MAGMESHWEVNVSFKGMHFFATAPRSAWSETDARILSAELYRRFPEAEGWTVTVTRWEGRGFEVPREAIKANAENMPERVPFAPKE